MSGHSLSKFAPILLVGAGPASSDLVTKAFAYADSIIAVDGGLTTIQAAGLQAEAVVGDFDSVADLGDTPKLHTPDQNFTDFQKALGAVDAPVILGVGFLGGRLDHQLAAFTALLQDARPVILVDDDICCFIAPQSLHVPVAVGSSVAFYPLTTCRADIEGVRYLVKDAAMSPTTLISTSNKMNSDVLTIRTMGRALLVILPAAALPQVISALT